MANLTVAIEGDTLKRARMRALEEGTSVNAVVRDYLTDYAGMKAKKDKAIDDLLRLSQRAKSRRGNRRWTREDLHQR
jgi:plasmid stability protein